MSKPTFPEPACLVVGVLARDADWLQLAQERLVQEFGPIEHQLGPFPFTWTNYYADELNQEPLRLLLSFGNTIDRSRLPSIKTLTNQWELDWADTQGRPVNLDPGYMTLGQFFLASTKDQRQRVYLDQGIYAEPTLYFEGGQWKPFEWTYRDWQSETYRAFFDVARQRFAYQRTTGRKWSER